MSELTDILTAASELLALREPAVLATLVGTVGSSYRPPGAFMLAAVGIPIVGGISGGCLEDYVAREGLRITAAGHSAVLSFDTTHDPDDPRPVPGCGGQLHVLVEPLSREHVEVLQAVVAAHVDNVSALVTTEVHGFAPGQTRVRRGVEVGRGEKPRKHGGTEESGGGNAVRVGWVATRQSRPAEDHWVMHRHLPPPLRLVILGAGDDCLALARQGKLLGWHITVADRRARLATRERFPLADAIYAEPWESALPKIMVSDRSALAIMTHSVPDDADIVPWALAQAAMFAGLLGPPSRRTVVLDELRRRGGSPTPEALARLRGPMGLDLGEKSPEAIALAIAAEILALANDRVPKPLTRPTLPRGTSPLPTLELA